MGEIHGYFIISHQNYNHDELCLELEIIRRHEGESTQEFPSRFILIFHRLLKANQTSRKDLFKWFLYPFDVYYANNISLMHVSKGTGVSVDFYSRTSCIESTDDIETVKK